jgi:uncharacterized protein (DUF2141 family)
MKTLAIALALFWLAQPVAAETAALELTVSGLDAPGGNLRVAMFADKAGYKDNSPVASRKIPVDAATATVRFEGLSPGRYAIKLHHDANANGEMDRNAVGLPKEAFGFSNNAPVRLGPPGWKAARFELVEGENTHAISVD